MPDFQKIRHYEMATRIFHNPATKKADIIPRPILQQLLPECQVLYSILFDATRNSFLYPFDKPG